MAPKDTQSTVNNPTLGRPANEDRIASSASAEDQTLLKALQDLIVRVMDPKETNDNDQILLGPEADRLITALQEFISSIIAIGSQSRAGNTTIKINLEEEGSELLRGNPKDEEFSNSESELASDEEEIEIQIAIPDDDELEKDENDLSDSLEDVEISAGIPSRPYRFDTDMDISIEPPSIPGSDDSWDDDMKPDALKEKLLRSLREHVNNKMPIRLLCFESYGESSFTITLIERGTIYARIASALQAELHEDELRPLQARQIVGKKSTSKIIRRLISKHTQYAILSHTWLRTTPGEVTYSDWNQRLFNSEHSGFQKLRNFCRAAWKDHRLTFGWMDTICINKQSSSELDESIRSMYDWYERAAVCITYLAETETVANMHLDPWFTRGWTLQELLAPRVIKFYNSHWQRLVNDSDSGPSQYLPDEDPSQCLSVDHYGPNLSYNNPWQNPSDSNPWQDLYRSSDKANREITDEIKLATTISESELDDIHETPISRRMQLAATREVTREEDGAYSLMGIFGISISTAYGEGGERAFLRLLQEIIASSRHALDVLNWAGDIPFSHLHNTSAILPTSPACYINRSLKGGLNIVRPIEPLTLSHLGLRIPVVLMPGISILDRTSQHSPIGDYTATVDISPTGNYNNIPTTYRLLDNRITGRDGWDNLSRHQITFAVFNFTGAGNITSLRKTCIALGLQCNEPAGKVTHLGDFDIIRTNNPIVFKLNKVDKNVLVWDGKIPTDELAKHGMQLISLYL